MSEPHPLGTVAIKFGRAYFAKDKQGQTHSSMLLAVMHGSTKYKGAEVSFSGAGRTIRVKFEYPGDDKTPLGDAVYQQEYEVDLGDLIEALHPVNEYRRSIKFVDAPPAQIP